MVTQNKLSELLHKALLAALSIGLFSPHIHAAEDQVLKPKNQNQTGNMISDGLIKAMLKRSVYEMSYALDMDDEQIAELDKLVNKRWTTFFQKHRKELSPVVDRAMQAMYDPDLPSAKEAQDWADKSLKLHDTFTKEVEVGSQEIAKILNDEQRKEFKKLMLQFHSGLAYLKVELNKMSQGRLDQTSWAKRRASRQKRRGRRQQETRMPAAGELSLSADLIPISIDAWEKYVIKFVENYDLDEAQRQSATKMLTDVKKRAVVHVASRRDEIDKALVALKTTSQEERKEFMDAKKMLFQPLMDLFEELKTRLESIPTQAQRLKAEGPNTS